MFRHQNSIFFFIELLVIIIYNILPRDLLATGVISLTINTD